MLVGDHKQLPATVISQKATSYGYNQSLFERMQKVRPQTLLLLDEQYRMHPEIASFPSRHFYGGASVPSWVWASLQMPWARLRQRRSTPPTRATATVRRLPLRSAALGSLTAVLRWRACGEGGRPGDCHGSQATRARDGWAGGGGGCVVP